MPAAERERLGAVLRPLGESFALPGAAYTSPDVFAWEMGTFFASGWVCVGRSADLERAGDQAAFAVGDDGVVLVRGEDGALRGFFNVCRHRGHELLEVGGSASRGTIQCPYHAWAYRLDGRLLGAPGNSDLDPDTFRLSSAPVAEWHGWAFVNASGDAPPFADWIGNLEELVVRHEPERLVTAATRDYVVAANWKVLHENYQECYHCSVIHPELCKVSPPTSGDNFDPDGAWLGGSMTLRDGVETMSLDGRSNGVPIAGLSGRERRTVMYLVGFPNLLISLHPDYVMTHLLTPLAVDRTRIECVWAFPPEMAGDPTYAVDFWDLTNRQDWAACESVQRGLRSPHAVPGPLAPAEDGVYQFVTRVAVAYLGGGVPK